MQDLNSLIGRIDAEFDALEKRIEKTRTGQVKSFEDREKRLDQFARLSEELRDIWKPRLEALAQRFGDRVHVTPTVKPDRREATFGFKSELAQILLRFSVSTNSDATKVVFSYDLRIIPILMKFESHSEVEFPLEAVDREAVAKWIDDRIVTFVRTYLSLHENEHYLKDHMVEDPVAHVRFPKFAAGATFELDGKTYYFLGEETRAQFEKEHGAPVGAAAKA